MGYNVTQIINKILNVQSNVQNVTLQSVATAVGNGTVLNIGGLKTLTIEISGTSTSRTVVFEAASESGTYFPIYGTNLQNQSFFTQTAGNNGVWRFDLTGLTTFRARISAVAGGDVTVTGKAVA